MNRLRLMAVSFFLFALLGGLWASGAARAQEQTLVVEGQIRNGTSGGGSVASTTVTFHQESANVHDDLEVATDEEGRFRFEGIVFDPATQYGVSVNYRGALYGKDLDLSSGSPPPVSLTVYDTADTDAALSASSVSVLLAGFDESARTVSALEIVRLVNNSDRTYVPGPEPAKMLFFDLPPGAQNLSVDTSLMGAEIAQTSEGFALIAGVPPGEHDLMYAYGFPYSGRESSFTKSFRYGAANLRVLAPPQLMGLSSDRLGSPEQVNIGERIYQLLEAADLPRGAEVTVRLSGLPESSFGERLGRRFEFARFEYVAPVALAAFMVVLLAFALSRRNRGPRRPAAEVPAAEDERSVISEMIAELEQSFEAGALSEDEYRRRLEVLGRRRTPHPGD